MSQKNKPKLGRLIASGIIGNMIEAYSLCLCGFLSPYIASNFLANGDAFQNLILTFYIVFIGYIATPLGGLTFGLVADKHGRKKALTTSIFLTGVITAIIGLIPSFDKIGYLATILLTVTRFLQGVASGGEHTSSIALLIEHVQPNQKGYIGSWATVGSNGGALIASAVCAVTSYFVTAGTLPDSYWRIPFFLSILGAAVGIWLRQSIPESIEFLLQRESKPSPTYKTIFHEALTSIKHHKIESAVCVGLTWLGSASTFLIFYYGPAHFASMNTITFTQATSFNAIALLVLVALAPFFGKWSDKIGREIPLRYASLSFLCLAYPYYYLGSYGDPTKVLLAQTLIAIPAACFYSVASTTIVELLPIQVRCTKGAILYTLTASILGGTSPAIALNLIRLTGDNTAPAFYLIFCSIIGVLACLALSFIGKNILPVYDNVYPLFDNK